MVVGIVAGDLLTEFLCEHTRKQSKAALIETSERRLPIDFWLSNLQWSAHAQLFMDAEEEWRASRARSVAFTSSPPAKPVSAPFAAITR